MLALRLTYSPSDLAIPRGIELISTEQRENYSAALSNILEQIDLLAAKEGKPSDIAKARVIARAAGGQVDFKFRSAVIFNGVEAYAYSPNTTASVLDVSQADWIK